jgi:hypothetical protein
MHAWARRYFQQTLRCGMRNTTVLVEMSKVNQMMVPPAHLFSPAIFTRVAALTAADGWRALLGTVRRLAGGEADSDAAGPSAAKA